MGSMHRFCRFLGFVFVCALVAGSLPLLGQQTDDLPAAPSEANKPKPSPKKATPPQQTTNSPADQTPPSSSPSASASLKADTSNSQDAQSANDQGVVLDSDTTVRSVVNEVSVVFTVTDKHNRYVQNLTHEDFKVVDDNRPVEKFLFRRDKDLPLQVGLLIDASNSIRDRFKFEQESAIEFLSGIIRPRYDSAFVLGFDIEPEVTQDFTDNTEKLANGVRMLKPGGGTALFDALYYACRDKLLKSPQKTSVRRAIILVSDGEDNQSHVTREEAIEMALRANVIVYTISTNFPEGGSSSGDRVLQRIADATGGRAFQPFQLQQVADAFQQVQADLRSQYELSYRPENFVRDGRFRTIEISALRKGLRVRSRNGYYAPTE